MKALQQRFDELIAGALPLAGERLSASGGAPSFLERHLEDALIEAIGSVDATARAKATGRGLVSVPNWDRRLGGFDLRLGFSSDPGSEALVETKVDDVEHTLWDLFKLAAALRMPGVDAAYMILARPKHRWDDGDCAALFAEREGPTWWVSEAMFVEWRAAWADLTGPRGGSARPLTVPSKVETAFIGAAAVEGFDGYEIRCVAVRLVPGCGELRFDGAWPAVDDARADGRRGS
jgi:hypothetical protein